MIDTDNSGQITLEKLKAGLKMLGNNLSEPEILDLMQAVSISTESSYNFLNVTIQTYIFVLFFLFGKVGFLSF